MDTDTYKAGDVIRHADGHPAVVLRTDENGTPLVVLVTSGPHRRVQQAAPLIVERVRSGIEIERARDVAREEWEAGNRWETGR